MTGSNTQVHVNHQRQPVPICMVPPGTHLSPSTNAPAINTLPKHQHGQVDTENLNRIHHRKAVTLRHLSVLGTHLRLRQTPSPARIPVKSPHKTARQMRRLGTHRTETGTAAFWNQRVRRVNRHALDQHEQTNTPIQKGK